jgi:hypothetical protein
MEKGASVTLPCNDRSVYNVSNTGTESTVALTYNSKDTAYATKSGTGVVGGVE